MPSPSLPDKAWARPVSPPEKVRTRHGGHTAPRLVEPCHGAETVPFYWKRKDANTRTWVRGTHAKKSTVVPAQVTAMLEDQDPQLWRQVGKHTIVATGLCRAGGTPQSRQQGRGNAGVELWAKGKVLRQQHGGTCAGHARFCEPGRRQRHGAQLALWPTYGA